ncbi:uncharacterized protein LOC144665187 isoform X1 [Oculina patagonica]
MGTGSAFRFKEAGGSKEFHGASVEVLVQGDVSERINVLFICDEWGSSKGGLSTFNREFAVNLAKASRESLKIYCYVCKSSEEDRQDASKQGVNLITAERVPGSSYPTEGLKNPPPEIKHLDVVVGHGRKFGGAAYLISDRTKCKWIHFVHVFCEDLGKHKLEGGAVSDAIAESEEKSKQELELCEKAHLVFAVGAELQEKYIRRIPEIKAITPGLLKTFSVSERQPHSVLKSFRVFTFGRGSFEDFELKGYDIIAKAISTLERRFELTFVGSPQGKQKKLQKWFLDETKIAKNQLTIRGYCDYKEIKKMFREADVIVMPSRTEGFGLVALEAISAGVPVLVSSESGLAKALEEVEGGMSVVVNSDRPQDWAERIKELSEQNPEDRHESALHLREQYGKIYNWENECKKFEQMVHELVQKPDKAVPVSCVLKDQYGNVTAQVETVVSVDKELAQTNKDPGGNPVSSTDTEAKQNQERDLLTEPGGHTVSSTPSTDRGANQNKDKDPLTAHDGSKVSPSSLTVTGVKQNNEQESSTEPDRSSKTKQTERNKEGSLTTDQAPSISLDKKGATSSKGLQVLPTDSNKNTSSQTSSECTEANSNKEGESATGSEFVDKDKNEWNSLHSAARDGDVPKIKSLLSRGFPIDSRDDHGRTPLMVAAYSDKLQNVEYLLARGADPSLEDNDGWNLLHWASGGGNPDIMELMLSHVPSIDSINNKGSTALMIAANGKLQAVEYLLVKGANPSLEDNNGWNLLHHASRGGNPVIIELMLSHVPSIDSIDKQGLTALMKAAYHGKLQAVEYLLAKGADPSLEDNFGCNLLYWASLGGNTAVIEKILWYGVDIKSRDEDGSTPLMIAQKEGQDEKPISPTSSTATGAKGESSTDQKRNSAPPMTSETRFKKTNKVEVLATDLDNSTASQTSTECRQEDSATDSDESTASQASSESTEQVSATGSEFVDMDKDEWNSLHDAAEDGDVTKIESLLSRGFSVDCRDGRGITPLMVAAARGKLQAVEYLLAKGANPSLEDNNGWNSLHYASYSGNPDIIELMLSHVPSIDSITNRGVTALMLAAANDKLQAVEYLLTKGANPSLENNDGWNVLHRASQGGNPVIIELMLSHVPSIDLINNKGSTALMLAARLGKLQAVECLLAKGANPSLEDNDGWNLLHWASQGGNPDIIELMLSHVPSIDSITNGGVTALMVAAANGKLQAVEYLLAKGADPSLEENNGWNLLHVASHGGNTAVIEKILSYGVDIESRTKAGETPLMVAQRKGKAEAVTYLLSKGAKPS